MRKQLILILLFTFHFTASAQEAASSAGTASALFLRCGLSPRAAGLAEAFTAVADNENALFYNPAGLPKLKMSVIGLNHTEWLEDIRFDNITFAYKFNRKIVAALAFSHLWTPSIQGKDEFGNNTESINVSSSICHLGLGYKLHPSLYLGIGLKYFRDDLSGYAADGIAFDAGFYMYTFIPRLTFGMALQNLGGKIQYDKEKQEIPLTYRAGLAYKFLANQFCFSTDIVKSVDTEYYFNFGVEYVYNKTFSLRAGNQVRQENMLTPAFGAGLQFLNRYQIDYSFYSPSELGATHRFGIKFKLNTPNNNYAKPVQSYYRKNSLQTPQNVTAKISKENLIISWKEQQGALYNVYARYSDNKTWKKITKTPISKNLKILKKPMVKGKYFFCVTLIIDKFESAFSKEAVIDVK